MRINVKSLYSIIMFYLKEASSLEEFDAFLELKSQKDAVKWSGFETVPDRDKFFQYYLERVLNNPITHVMFLHDEDEEGDPIIGYVQYDDIDNEHVETRGSVILKRYQGTGVYQIMIDLLHDIFREKGVKYIETWASEKNKPSIYNLQIEGYTRLEEYDIRIIPLLGGEHKFYKWVKEL